MATKVSIDQMASVIMDGLKEYADLATDDLKAAVKKTGNEVRKQIQSLPQKPAENTAKAGQLRRLKNPLTAWK